MKTDLRLSSLEQAMTIRHLGLRTDIDDVRRTVMLQRRLVFWNTALTQ